MSNILRISEAASLALHTSVLLAANAEAFLATREIAESLGVSEAHLSKVLQRLAKVGLVHAVRGPGGGFKLAKSGKDISLLEVYEVIEGPLGNSNCLLTTPVCQNSCLLGDLIIRVNTEVRAYLETTSLNDVVGTYGGQHDENE